jgi:hypothetical protein
MRNEIKKSLMDEREIFGSRNETFLRNCLLNPRNLKKFEAKLRSEHPDLEFRFDASYIVDSQTGIIFDGKNYARWCHKPHAMGYAIYTRPIGEAPAMSGPKESSQRLMGFISAATSHGRVLGEQDWQKVTEKIAWFNVHQYDIQIGDIESLPPGPWDIEVEDV